MQIMEFRVLTALLTNKKSRNFLLIGLAASTLAVGGGLAWMRATSQPEIVAEPALQCDSSWLLTATPDKAYSREQLKLFLTNQDPTICQKGMLWGEIEREALRMLGEASVSVRDRKHKCFNKTLEFCLDSFLGNVEREWKKAVNPSDKIRAISRFWAVALAQASLEGEAQLQPSESGDALFLRLIEKFREDRAASHSQTPDGIAAEARRQAAAEREAAKDAAEGFSFFEPSKAGRGKK